jgi:hypothetical protein
MMSIILSSCMQVVLCLQYRCMVMDGVSSARVYRGFLICVCKG